MKKLVLKIFDVFYKFKFHLKFGLMDVFFYAMVSVLLGFFLFTQFNYYHLKNDLPSGISSSKKWSSIEIFNKYGVNKGGLTSEKADNIFKNMGDVVNWYTTFENGNSEVKINGQLYSVNPQLYTRNALEQLEVKLYTGNYPNINANELLISYEFWTSKLNRMPNIVGKHLIIPSENDDESIKFIISGVTSSSFYSLFQGSKFDVFVNAQSWVTSINGNPMLWDFFYQVKSALVGVVFKPNINKALLLDRLNTIAENNGYIDNNKYYLRVFNGLMSTYDEKTKSIAFLLFFNVISFSLLLLVLLTLFLFQFYRILNVAKVLKIRFVLGEDSMQIAKQNFFSVLFFLMLSMMFGLILFKILLLLNDRFNIISVYNIEMIYFYDVLTLTLFTFLGMILIPVLISIITLKILFNKTKKAYLISTIVFVVTIIIFLILLILTGISYNDLDDKMKNNRNFQISNIYQWNIIKDTKLISDKVDLFDSRVLEKQLLQSLKNIKGFEKVIISSVTPIHGYNYKSTEEIGDDGKSYVKQQYWANVPLEYFSFFKIPLISGEIPKNPQTNNVVINESLAFENSKNNAYSNNIDNGGNIISAIVKDAHFLDINKISPSFTYSFNSTYSSNNKFFILIKGIIDDDLANKKINEVLLQYNGIFKISKSAKFEDEYKEFFINEINRFRLLLIILIMTSIFGIFALYFAISQWKNIKKKNISIKLTLGLTKSRMIITMFLRTIVFITVLTIVAVFIVFSLLDWLYIVSNFNDLLSISLIIIATVALLSSVIYSIIINKIDEDFISSSLHR